jgi:hypothetical protein
MSILKILSAVLLGTALLGVSAGAFSDRWHRDRAQARHMERHIERGMDIRPDLPSPALEVHHGVSQGIKYGQEGVQDGAIDVGAVAQ